MAVIFHTSVVSWHTFVFKIGIFEVMKVASYIRGKKECFYRCSILSPSASNIIYCSSSLFVAAETPTDRNSLLCTVCNYPVAIRKEIMSSKSVRNAESVSFQFCVEVLEILETGAL